MVVALAATAVGRATDQTVICYNFDASIGRLLQSVRESGTVNCCNHENFVTCGDHVLDLG